MKECNVDGRTGKEKPGVLELWKEEYASIPPVPFQEKFSQQWQWGLILQTEIFLFSNIYQPTEMK